MTVEEMLVHAELKCFTVNGYKMGRNLLIMLPQNDSSLLWDDDDVDLKCVLSSST